jgi:hypothetical protein
VAGERHIRIVAKLTGGRASGLKTKRLCEVCAEVTGLSGAGILLMSGDVPQGSVCTTNKVSALLEQLQFELGEGPCIDAHHQQRPVLEPHLAAPITPRWPAFTGPALDAGVRAVFSFPLHVAAVGLGALNLYSDRAGSLTDDQHADALVMAELAAQAVLLMQANAPPGRLAAELEADADFHYVVHQASGMVAATLEVSVDQAFMRLRAYAFGHDRRLAEVVEDVVARTLRFDDQSGENDLTP